MKPSHFLNIYLVETERLFRRATAIIGLVLSVLFALSGPTLAFLINTFAVGPARTYAQTEMAPQLTPEAAATIGQGPDFLGWDWAMAFSYYGRNFMFVPILIFLLGGLIMASEFVARTTREDVLRPSPRWGLFAAKWLALITWCLAASLLLGGLSSIFGWLLCGGLAFDDTALINIDNLQGTEVVWAYFSYVWNPIADEAFQFFSTLVTDIGFATLSLTIAVLTRSVAATVASLVMVFMVQLALSFGFMVVGWDMVEMAITSQAQWADPEVVKSTLETLRAIGLWQPPFIMGACPWAPTAWQGFVTLTLITMGGLGIGFARIETMDVP